MKYFSAILLIANYLAIDANKILVLPTIIDNGLTDAESDLAMATAILQSEKTKDKATISESIVNELTEQFGGVWNVLVTNYNQYDGNSISVRFQTKKLLSFVHERSEYLVVKNEQTSAKEVFQNLLTAASKATVKRGYVYDVNNSLDDVLSFVNKSLKSDYSVCSRNYIGWIDAFGDCYRLMADSVLADLRSKYGGRWSVTVGETNSHFQSWSQSIVGYELPNYWLFVAQFSLGNLHFNILQIKPQN